MNHHYHTHPTRQPTQVIWGERDSGSQGAIESDTQTLSELPPYSSESAADGNNKPLIDLKHNNEQPESSSHASDFYHSNPNGPGIDPSAPTSSTSDRRHSSSSNHSGKRGFLSKLRDVAIGTKEERDAARARYDAERSISAEDRQRAYVARLEAAQAKKDLAPDQREIDGLGKFAAYSQPLEIYRRPGEGLSKDADVHRGSGSV